MDEKLHALNGVLESANNYLEERGEDSYQSRALNCVEIADKIGKLYARIDESEIVKKDFRSVDYVVNADHLTDAQIRQEIQFAYKLAHGKKSALNSVPSKRISAFRRKKEESVIARRLTALRSEQDAKTEEIIKSAKEKYGIESNEWVDEFATARHIADKAKGEYL